VHEGPKLNCTFLTCICHLSISTLSKDNMSIKINEPLFSTSRMYYTITLSVKHCDGRSEFALIKPTFHLSIFLYPSEHFGINYDKYYKQTTLIRNSVGYNGLHY